MDRRCNFLIVLLLGGLSISAQSKDVELNTSPLNGVNLNLLGDASFFSLNYERYYLSSSSLLFSSKIGVGYNEEFKICIFGPCDPPEKFVSIPYHFTANFGKHLSFFEIGLGGTILLGEATQSSIFYPIMGLRILPFKVKKLGLRLYGEIPFSGFEGMEILFFPVGVSMGYCF